MEHFAYAYCFLCRQRVLKKSKRTKVLFGGFCCFKPEVVEGEEYLAEFLSGEHNRFIQGKFSSSLTKHIKLDHFIGFST